MGRTDNQHRRHYTDYRRQGSSNHLLPLFEDALRRGYTIWRRIAYLKASCSKMIRQCTPPASLAHLLSLPVFNRWRSQDEEDAKRKERWLLSIFDYAWNHASNGHSKRQLELQVSLITSSVFRIALRPRSRTPTYHIHILSPCMHAVSPSRLRGTVRHGPEAAYHFHPGATIAWLMRSLPKAVLR